MRIRRVCGNAARALCATCVSLVCLSGAVSAETPVTYTDEGRAIFHYTLPDFWQLRSGGVRIVDPDGPEPARTVNRVMGMSPSGDTSAFLALVSPLDVSTLEEGRAYLADVGRFLVQDAQVSDLESRRVAGLPALRATGQGRRNGRRVSFTASVMDLPNGRVIVAVAVLEAGADAAAVDGLNAIFASLRAAR